MQAYTASGSRVKGVSIRDTELQGSCGYLLGRGTSCASKGHPIHVVVGRLDTKSFQPVEPRTCCCSIA